MGHLVKAKFIVFVSILEKTYHFDTCSPIEIPHGVGCSQRPLQLELKSKKSDDQTKNDNSCKYYGISFYLKINIPYSLFQNSWRKGDYFM